MPYDTIKGEVSRNQRDIVVHAYWARAVTWCFFWVALGAVVTIGMCR